MQRRNCAFEPLFRSSLDYTNFAALKDYLSSRKPSFVINAAGYTGKPNVDACEENRAETLWGNTLFPQTLAQACAVTRTPWGHVSSGCIYSGAWVESNGKITEEKDLTEPKIRDFILKNPSSVKGFKETDVPNFSFRKTPCSFYSGTKALGEEAIQSVGPAFIWRLRIPFNEIDSSRNYISKLLRYPKVYQNVNSISHLQDFAQACLDLWENRSPMEIYNVTNEGWITTDQAISWIQKILKPEKQFEFWENDEEFYKLAAKTPRSNCVLDTSKLKAAGIKMRPVEEAFEHALHHWKPQT